MSSICNCRWGSDHEVVARKCYTDVIGGQHENFHVSDVGLIINTSYPFLGSTPDGKVMCDCHGKGMLEIKCPYSLLEKSFLEKLDDKAFCLTKSENGTVSLDPQHDYFYQVQCQMQLTEAEYCDFIVWCPSEIYVQRILPDPKFFENAYRKVCEFLTRCILPEMIGKAFTAPRSSNEPMAIAVPSVGIGCYCGEPVVDRDDMLSCTSDFCKRKKFHKSCLKVKKATKTWKCADCTKIINKAKRDSKPDGN